ncbi:MAG: DMT family transporter [Thermoanaerobaculia bacterium]|nr:DMT family transporter [Thermoanaerobaculia bacterium]
MTRPSLATAFLTSAALVAFAGNSILCRLALGRGLIDPISFTTLRVVGGALALAVLVVVSHGPTGLAQGRWPAALALVLYAIPFSLAYTSLDTGLGALVLFAAVQLSMLALAVVSGERLRAPQIAGSCIAFAGLLYLCWPGGTGAPSSLAIVLMLVAGTAWGVYSVLGRHFAEPLVATAGNFLFAVPFVVLASLLTVSDVQSTPEGAALALISGVLTSGLGYAVWYSALRSITTTTAATVQLSVPVLASIGGVLLLSETPTLRLVVASVVILGGIAVSLRALPRSLAKSTSPGATN